MIRFVSECLNFYQYTTHGSSSAHNVLFGTPLDYNNIKCDDKHFCNVFDHLNHGKYPAISFEKSEKTPSELLKQWYCQESKDQTSKILDYFTASKNKLSRNI